ncbi:MAG: right-handed parallel beta-helix repeat-containing protein [Verrucomicrobiaceae bacterium]|nr:right-handed parallel beta-helix repeat-containing protein [Verrucomicrobiaceae bacterium]
MRMLPLLLACCLVSSISVFSAPALPQVAARVIDAAKFSSLQAAFDAVPESGGIVLVPPGDYEITRPLVVRTAETRIAGSGAATHIINKNEEGLPALILEPANAAQDKKARLWRVQVADVRISGSEKSGDGILAHFIEEIYLEGVSIDHNGRHGIFLDNCQEDPRIADSIITYNKGSGIEIKGCHDIVVNANHFEENQDALRCLDSFNLCMNGNNIDDHLGNGVVIENTYGSVLSGNMIEECNGTAIILDRDCYGITVSANVIAHHLEGGIDLRDAWGCAISANTFTIAHKFSVRAGKDAGRNTISANNFCNTHIGGQDKRPVQDKTPMGIDEGTGILLAGTSDTTISGNTFGGLSTAAVWAEDACERILVSGNIATDCGRRLPADAKCFNLSGSKDSIEKDNLVSCKQR